jgi:hypothetical protein
MKESIKQSEKYREFEIVIIDNRTHVNCAILYPNQRVFNRSNTYNFQDGIPEMIKEAKGIIDRHYERQFTVGDVVKTRKGSIGIVVDAAADNEYALEFIILKGDDKNAWWDQSEGLKYLCNVHALLRGNDESGYLELENE